MFRFLGIIRRYFNTRRKDIQYLNTSTVHSLLVFSQIHGRLVKIDMSPSVSVIYLRTDHKSIPIFIINERRERMYWEGCGKISNLKTIFYKSHYFYNPS